MHLKDFTENYVYKFDPSYDQWRILKGDKYEGDCEDFALSVLYYVICNESLLAFWRELIFGKAKIHYVSNDGGHAVLQWNGKYIDNWTKDWVSKEDMERLGHKFDPWMFTWFQVAIKMLYGRFKALSVKI